MLSASAVLSVALLAGRLSGLLRELTLASLFGVTPDADAAVLLLTIPDLFVNLLISGGLSAALVPRFNGLSASEGMKLFRQASFAITAVFALIGLLLAVWPAAIFKVLSPGLNLPLATGATALMCVAAALPLAGASGIAGAYLNAKQRYFVTGCGTLLFNASLLVTLFAASGSAAPLTLLSVGIVFGAAVRWGAQVVTLPKDIWRATVAPSVVDSTLLRAFTAATVASGLMLLAPILVRAMASTLGAGTIASFNYAQKLVELPVAILIGSISTVALTRISALVAEGQSARAITTVVRDTKYALLVAIAVVALGIWFADSVVHIVFSRGEMNLDALARVTGLTQIALLAVPLVAVSGMATAFLNANNMTHKILVATAGSLLLLPVFAGPGLIFSSERGLMFAVVAFQACAAFWLMRSSGLPVFGDCGVLASSVWRSLATVALIVAASAALDHGLNLHNHWLRLLLAGGAMGLVFVFPIRRFLMSSPQPQRICTAP
jgi:putative peptidoglycan lipid II flippase